MKDLVIIAAIGKNNELGLENRLIWHIPGDLKFFKEKTLNKNIVMGYKTYESLPGLLKLRNHIVMTHKDIKNNDIIIVNSLEELFNYINPIDDDVFVIGGASIYKLLMPYSNKMFITQIDSTSKADAYFPKIIDDEWEKKLLDSNFENGVNYKHYEYKRIKK